MQRRACTLKASALPARFESVKRNVESENNAGLAHAVPGAERDKARPGTDIQNTMS